MSAPDAPAALTVMASATAFGHHRWIEQQLFEVLGGWVQSVADPAVKVMLATHSQHRAWHASLWEERVPRTREVDLEAVTAPARPEVAAVLEALRGLEGDVARLAGAYRVVLPALVVAHDALAAVCTPAADQPTARVLRLVLADDLDHWRTGEAHLQRLTTDAAALDEAAAAEAAVRALLVAAGGLHGFPAGS